MLTVDEFSCFTLETGGIIVFSIYNCEDLWNLGKHNVTFEDFMSACSITRPLILALLVVAIMFPIGLGVISYYCIKGTKLRKHNYINPMRILLGINIVLPVLVVLEGTLSLNPTRIVLGLIYIVCASYFFVVIHSLYKVFLEEFIEGLNE